MIYLFRHGVAADRQPGMDDAARPLTDEGVEKTRAAAAGLVRLIETPEAILTSPKLRARQTAELLGEAFDLECAVFAPLGEGPAEAIIEALADRREPSLVLVGHEPDFSEATERLCFGGSHGGVKLKKAGCAAVEIGGGDAPRPGAGQLRWLATGKMLRRLGG